MINEQDVLSEIEFCRKTKDLIKIKILLRELPNLNETILNKILTEVDLAESSYAIPLLIHILVNHIPIVQAYPEIENIVSEKIIGIYKKVLKINE